MKNTTDKIRVLLADDHLVVRMGLVTLLSLEDDICVVGEACDGGEAVRLAIEKRPDVVIMDVMMPEMDGARATAEIIRNAPGVKILLLTTYSSAAEVGQGLRAGATGALVKECAREDLVEAIRATARGESVISPLIRAGQASQEDTPTLSPRQIEILSYVAKGLTTREIAQLVGIGQDGVKNHLRAIFLTLNTATRAEAVTVAMHYGLLS